MQREIAPPDDYGSPDRTVLDLVRPLALALDQANTALAMCLDEIELLQERVARLELDVRAHDDGTVVG